ncbi:putative disease resistance protein RGA3 [Beta vulgaris subsp. vulgaris]|uniref:putative disease resistance protein RGA3 n=1 Tax=Beta vulgaris subsp. vulgaris TaxID=3555 RepID=UPI0020376529|nr:putative disease resistance protein RGA3 [Beta vulgaris subsp. vulgaris]
MAAEGVLVDIASKFLGYLAQSAFQEVSSWWGVKGDLKKFEQSLSLIRARVTDAEKHQEGENSAAIKEWLRRLRAVLYRADDLFDDLYIAQQRKKRTKGDMAKKVRLLFSSSSPVLFNIELARELKSIRQDLDDIKSDMDGLHLSVCDHRGESRLQMARLMSKRETTSFVQPDEVVGREGDKDAIISMLLDPVLDEQSIFVIPIVGFGDIGKTTLAQLVFNDERVKHHFELTKWACVPMIDDHKEFMRKVFRCFTDNDHQSRSLEELQSCIRTSIENKKYLLVLDDMWDESRDRWLSLMSLFRCGSKGSKIIVTARSNVVAEVVGTVPTYKIGFLTDGASWELFKRLALKEGQEEDNPNFTKIGKEIVDRCANVPLAIRVIGSLLYSKDSEQEWLLFREAHLSKTKMTGENDIMPVLKLSYDFLPSPLKQCFAYCSLFPKDYEFKKTELVQLWMAQGYIEPSQESLSLEDAGGLYFLELQRRNLFQDVKEVALTGRVTYKMHDLVHDLALHVAGLEEKTFEGSFEEGRSSSSLLTMRKMRSIVNAKFSSPCLREMIPFFQSLRALSLVRFAESTLPDCIGRLRRLRYLNLEHGRMKCLPNFIAELECLQTLNLDDCCYLKRWPRGFSNLANLRHLRFQGCEFRDMPSGFEKMKSLIELNKFIVGKVSGLDTLGALDLKGDYVEIDFCKCRIDSVGETRRVNMKDNQRLKLNFCMKEETPKSGDMELMLECLILPPNLEELSIGGYSGERFPTWMLPNLVTVKIYNCKSCVQLPQFSQLPFLKWLDLSNLEALEYIEEDGWGGDGESCSATHFTALEFLYIRKMPKLKGWFWRPRVKDDVHPVPQQAAMTSDVHQDLTSHRLLSFPRLSTLYILDCPQFVVSMPLTLLPRLEEFHAQNIHE